MSLPIILKQTQIQSKFHFFVIDPYFYHLKSKLGISPGETTLDNQFSLLKVECLGACGTAPAMRINDDYYESLTLNKIDELIDKLAVKSVNHPSAEGPVQ
ncbi:NAD(P)H-dependent oxidoreductase subunit E [candidate division KSB1 bacterium]|nr:NAD(P)H-dependent oxidoreductase subunit E [candidate division KSB1 bacterium]